MPAISRVSSSDGGHVSKLGWCGKSQEEKLGTKIWWLICTHTQNATTSHPHHTTRCTHIKTVSVRVRWIATKRRERNA
jgi:hypothetical protein